MEWIRWTRDLPTTYLDWSKAPVAIAEGFKYLTGKYGKQTERKQAEDFHSQYANKTPVHDPITGMWY